MDVLLTICVATSRAECMGTDMCAQCAAVSLLVSIPEVLIMQVCWKLTGTLAMLSPTGPALLGTCLPPLCI
jgi:hypothetical protein